MPDPVKMSEATDDRAHQTEDERNQRLPVPREPKRPKVDAPHTYFSSLAMAAHAAATRWLTLELAGIDRGDQPLDQLPPHPPNCEIHLESSRGRAWEIKRDS